MIEHVWSVLCTRSVTDQNSNNISLLEVVEQVNILEPPPTGVQRVLLAMPFELVSLWQRSSYAQPARGEGRIRIEMASGSETLPSFQVDMTTAGMHRMRTVLRMNGLPFDGLGVYRFVVELREDGSNEWVRVAAVPLEVRQGMPQTSVSPQ